MPRLTLRQTVDCTEYRVGGVADAKALTHLYEDFFAQSNWREMGLAFDHKRAELWLHNVLTRQSVPHVLALEKVTGRLVGSISYGLEHTGTDRSYAVLDKLFIRPEWWLTGVGRLLLAFALDLAQNDGAAAFRACLSSGIGRGKNLFKHCGFRESPGSILMERNL